MGNQSNHPGSEGLQERPLTRWQRFRNQKGAFRAYRFLQFLVFIALLADFLANDKPIYARIEGRHYFPVFHQYAVDAGLASWQADFVTTRWQDRNYQTVIWPPIPYAAQTIDLKNSGFTGPFDRQRVEKWSRRHWLGTDQLGRDLLAGLIGGTRIALLVGLVAMAIAGVIGVFLGATAGYFGDSRLLIPPLVAIVGLVSIIWIWYYWLASRSYDLMEGRLIQNLSYAVLCSTVWILLLRFLTRYLHFRKRIAIPLDSLVLRSIEIVSALPGIMLILGVLALIKQASIYHIMVIIGLISWTGMARFARAEMIRIRSLPYIEAAQTLGFSHWRIIRKHALPNMLSPILISLAFGMAGAVLTEAFLSFLGLGLGAEEVSWGSLLNMAKSNTAAWWMAVFPGLAIFLLVMVFNLIGEGLTRAIERTA